MTVGCFYSNDQVIGLPVYNPVSSNISWNLAENQDVAVINIVGDTTDVLLFQNANVIQVPPGYSVILFFNQLDQTEAISGETYVPTTPPTGQTFYGIVVNEPSQIQSQGTNPAYPSYTFNVNGVQVYFNSQISQPDYFGIGTTFQKLTPSLLSVSNILQTYGGYYPLSVAVILINFANQSEICGDFIVGSPDPIFIQPITPTGVQQAVSTTAPQIGIPPLPAYAPPPPPPVPTKKPNQTLVYGGVLGALLVAGALAEKKLR
jgi:hypothetical protein